MALERTAYASTGACGQESLGGARNEWQHLLQLSLLWHHDLVIYAYICIYIHTDICIYVYREYIYINIHRQREREMLVFEDWTRIHISGTPSVLGALCSVSNKRL